MKYRIFYKPKAQKFIEGLRDKALQKRLLTSIDRLSEGVHPSSIKMAGSDDFYRIRVGDYRIIYQVDQGVLTILVLTIGHRREVYR